jgi:enoyl-CoA hydratase
MLDCGFLDEIAPRDRVLEKALELAQTLARNAPNAVQAMKRSLNEIADHTGDLRIIDARFAESLRFSELADGLAARAEKRSPTLGAK